MDSRGYMWFGTTQGLQRYDGRNFKTFKHIAEDSTSISGDFIIDFAEDSQGYLWVATNNSGLNRFDPITETFSSYIHTSKDTNSIADNLLNKIFIDSRENIWVGVKGGFDLLIDEETGIFKHFKCPTQGLSPWDIIEDINDPNIFWIGMKDGLLKFNHNSEQYDYFLQPKLKIIDGGFLGLVMTDEKSIWGGGFNNGLLKFNPITEKWTTFINKHNNQFVSFNNDKKLWEANYANPETYKSLEDRKNINFPPIFVTDVFPLSKDKYLISTYSQEVIRVFDTKSATFNKIHLDSSIVHTSKPITGREVIEDLYGRLWLPVFESPYEEGIFYLDPIQAKDKVAPIYLTEMKINEKEKKWEKNINYLEEIVLQPEENSFDIGFVYLNYSYPDSNLYHYKLEGLDKDWRQTDQEHNFAKYNNLSSGTYIFKVNAWNPIRNIRNNEGLSMKIIIRAPWYKTIWAYLIYASLLLLVLGVLMFFQRQRYQLMIKNKENEKLQALNSLREKLYTNITHEFRTPLTVIQGMVDKMTHNPTAKELIKKHTNDLLILVNQMLDLAKIESNNMSIQWQQSDIIIYLKYITYSFQSLANKKHISLGFYSPHSSLYMDFDAAHLEKIISNLLSNSIKFTPEYGSISVEVLQDKKVLHIKVKDTGIGIAEKDLPLIFNRFHQVDDSDNRKVGGTGIGLALVKELVHLLGGKIRVESTMNKGSDFILTLPITKNVPLGSLNFKLPNWSNMNLTPATSLVVTNDLETLEFPLLLIIEDNQDIIFYLKSLLEQKYIIAIAKDGNEGINKAIELVPDIILCDVMMPEKDGFAVTKELKSDWRTSHIPIILLTAKGDQKSKEKGLNKGADAYLIKPFSKEELFIRLEQLLKTRTILKTKYQNLIEPEISIQNRQGTIDVEAQFLFQLNKILQDNIDRSNFNIYPDLCRAMMMSKSQLYRKVTALTGLSPKKYFIRFRLQKSRQLLLTTNKQISQIALEVGIEDASYFTRVYSAHFRETPSETRNQLNNR